MNFYILCLSLTDNFKLGYMRTLLVAAMMLLAAVSGEAAQPLRYVDAAKLNVIGKALPVAKPFARIDVEKHSFNDATIDRYAGYSTGLAIAFKTDSKTIAAKWTTGPGNAGDNMTAISNKGMDLYIKKDGKWVFAGVARPDMKNPPYDNHAGTVVANMEEGVKECLLYLPLFDRVDHLEIGVDEGSDIRPMDNPFKHRIIVKGSSVTHGASASRPGMTYAARLSRDTGWYCINLGFSGRSKLQKEYAVFLAQVEADAFIFDTFSNPSAEIIYENFNQFVDIIRETHPETPMIFMQTERRESRNFNQNSEKFESDKQKAAEEMVKARMKTDKNIYFITSEDFLGHDHEATVDGSHPTDLGFTYMLESITPQIKKILKKYL